MKRNQKHLGSAKGSTFTKSPIEEDVPFTAQSYLSDLLLTGKYKEEDRGSYELHRRGIGDYQKCEDENGARARRGSAELTARQDEECVPGRGARDLLTTIFLATTLDHLPRERVDHGAGLRREAAGGQKEEGECPFAALNIARRATPFDLTALRW